MFRKNKNMIDREYDTGVIKDVAREGEEWIVRVNGVYWRARSAGKENFDIGDVVRVIGRERLTLRIVHD